jgi:hypothetical protein
MSEVNKKILFVLPQAAGDIFMSTALLRDLKETYPEFKIFYATRKHFFPLLEKNPYVDFVVEYEQRMDTLLKMEGQGRYSGYFDICFLPHLGTQYMYDYQHNGLDRINFDLKYASS